MAAGGMINIPSANTDPNYRYRMPRLVSKVEGRGNGIKTNIMNMAEIARALKRPPEYPTKFCGTELCAQSKFDLAEGKAIVNGAHETRDLQAIIDRFVEKYVLCPHCTLPEIDIVVKKGLVGCHCNACGHSGDLDNGHKISTFILRNPPKGSESTMGKTAKGGKAERKERKARGAGAAEEEAAEEEAESGGEGGGKKKKSKKKSKTAADGDEGDEADSGEHADEEGGGKKKHHKKGKKKGCGDEDADGDALTYDSPEIWEVKERLLAFMAKLRAESEVEGSGAASSASSPLSGRLEGVAAEAFFTELRVLQVSQDFDPVLRLFIALDVLLTPDWKKEPEDADNVPLEATSQMIDEILPYLRKCIDTSMDTVKTCVALEDFLALRCKHPESTDNFKFLLHTLFVNDLLEEEDLIARYALCGTPEEPDAGAAQEKPKKKKRHHKKHAEPPNPDIVDAVQSFVSWLQEEEEEDSDEEPATTAATLVSTQGKCVDATSDAAKENSDEALDIDDI